MRRVAGDGVTLAVADEGDGPAVVLLHGFPDSSRLWRKQVPALAERAFASSRRTCAASASRTSRRRSRTMRSGTASRTSWRSSMHWGSNALASSATTGAQPLRGCSRLFSARVERLVALSVPHPATLRERTIEQREKAWYQLWFQFAGVAEEVLPRDDWKLMRELLRGAGDIEHYVADLSRPGALTAALNWYRANAAPQRELEQMPPLPPVAAPTLGIWSSGDNYLTEDRMRRSGEHVGGPWRYERIEGASHWMQLDAPDRVPSCCSSSSSDARPAATPEIRRALTVT